MYDNVRMMDPQGNILCTISRKKANWYVRTKSLADFVEDGTAIRLRFEPKGRSGSDETNNLRTYIVSPKRNVCVACGKDEHHQRHYIVPYAYRTLLPTQYKTHLSHDIVILCPKCHLLCEQAYQERIHQTEDRAATAYERQYAKKPNSVLQSHFVDSRLYQVRSQALALLRWKSKLPADKAASYNHLVREHLGLQQQQDDLTKDQLQMAIDVQYKIPNPDFVPGARLVVDALEGNHDKIEAFIKEWRRFFLDVLQPRHLPNGWSLHSSVTSDKGNRNAHQTEASL